MLNQSIKESIHIDLADSHPSGSKISLPLIIFSLMALSLFLALLILEFGLISFYLILISIIALPLIYIMLAYPKTGILILLTLAYVIMFLAKFTSFPLGTLMDGAEILLIFGFFLKQKYQQNWRIFKTPITSVVIIWICFNLFEVFNPSAESTLAWLYSVRPIVLVALTYFIFQFYIDDVKFLRLIIKLWIALSFVAAVYALKQEYFGFAYFEIHEIKSSPILTNLYFIGNHWRKFSIFSDPVSFAYNMVISSILCFCLMTGPFVVWKKVTLGALGSLFFLAMLYSGTRGAYVLFPVAFVLYCVLKYNKTVLFVAVFALLIVGALIFMPTSNYTLYRFQTAFKPDKDASFNVRKENQKKIQPFIQSHPLGGGVGSTGVWGKRFSPYSYLANFPPDSGYVRVAVEEGWIGLFIFCTFMFVVLRTGIKNYFSISDPELKSYSLAMVMIVFALNVGNYPQEAIVQYPANVYFYLAVALLNITLKLNNDIVNSDELVVKERSLK